MTTVHPLRVSLSAVQAFRRCQQQYYYRYVERLSRKDKAPAPELGIILHDYLATYYRWISANVPAIESHQTGLLKISADYVPEIKRQANFLRQVGSTEAALELLSLPSIANRIAERYYKARGIFDAERFDILFVEHNLSLQINSRITSNGTIDLVTRDRDKGIVHLWEHKSTGNVPDTTYRLRDLQTVLYAEKLAQVEGVEIDAVLWNYIRTKEPTIPEQLKSGGLTKRADLDSTWEVYAHELTRLGLSPNDYQEQRQRLEGRELSVFFPRFEQPLVSDSDILLRDYEDSAKDIRRYMRVWEDGSRAPVRSLDLNCTWCEYKDLCTAAILSGDESDVINLKFVRRK